MRNDLSIKCSRSGRKEFDVDDIHGKEGDRRGRERMSFTTFAVV